jgi:hypothetical protein
VSTRRLRQRRARVAAHRDHGHGQARQVRQQRQQFGRVAGVGDGQQHVAAHHHAHIPVAGFGRMQEEGAGAGAGERGGDLGTDVPGLAKAAHHDAAGGRCFGRSQAQRAGPGEGGIEPCRQRRERLGLDLQRAPARGDQCRRAAPLGGGEG